MLEALHWEEVDRLRYCVIGLIGTFLGLSKLLVGTSDFDELLALAGKGQSDNLDLMIKDICHGQETPLSSLTSENIAVRLLFL